MNKDERDALFEAQRERYPLARLQDLLKGLHQALLGCGHFASADEEGIRRLKAEYDLLEAAAKTGGYIGKGDPVEPLACGFSRAHLWPLRNRLRPEVLQRLFSLCSGIRTGREEEMIRAVRELEKEGDQGKWIRTPEDEAFLHAYSASVPRMLSHSASFHKAYLPAYRVLSEDVVQLLPVLFLAEDLLKSGKRAVLAIDGRAASGKSSLSMLLHKAVGASVIHMDDFFLRPEQRTQMRYAEPGGNVDRERFAQEVLPNLRGESGFSYTAFDCSTMSLGQEKTVSPAPLLVVEGSYSLHPFFGRYYDASVFLWTNEKSQIKRIRKRNGDPEMFARRWIPLEEAYFTAFRIRENSTLPLQIRDTEVHVEL